MSSTCSVNRVCYLAHIPLSLLHVVHVLSLVRWHHALRLHAHVAAVTQSHGTSAHHGAGSSNSGSPSCCEPLRTELHLRLAHVRPCWSKAQSYSQVSLKSSHKFIVVGLSFIICFDACWNILKSVKTVWTWSLWPPETQWHNLLRTEYAVKLQVHVFKKSLSCRGVIWMRCWIKQERSQCEQTQVS